ncbi:FecR family protein [Teredinibacter sp. KSP-S5-2]|uniref:FecR family protein n=1 Tax=Teredinibacter sp. KSP-S5-2 TaxID=3034506 RepID=UPI002935127C|nr:FecR domain-containing protein [Teredinibacter sp. KSP-S5-2]WNO07645.1 FecR domain-containing protein [Teredinibacter sp. KSP-S5-2]
MTKAPLNKAKIEAEEWFVRLQSGALNKHQMEEFQRWYHLDDSHKIEFHNVEQDWKALGQLSKEIDPNQFAPPPAKPAPRMYNAFFRYGLATAFIFICAIVGFAWEHTRKPQIEEYATSVGEQKSVTLSDGSIVTLNTATKLQVNFQQSERALHLKQGEAYFEVAKDPDRPFSVDIDRGTVTAVGTAFNIRKSKHLASIVVTEGTVKVEEAKTRTNLEPAEEKVTVNEQIEFDGNGLTDISKVEKPYLLSWKEKYLAFDQQPLEDVIKELNRYLNDPVRDVAYAMKQVKISGTFDLSAPEDALNALLLSNALKLDQQNMSIY